MEIWSWLTASVGHHRWSLYAVGHQPLKAGYSRALIKWARKPVKKRTGHLQTKLYLTRVRSSKPNGARMGSGRGRPSSREGQLTFGQSLLVYSLLEVKKIQQVKKFYKKSGLALKLVQTRL